MRTEPHETPSTCAATTGAAAPRVWLLMGHKAGDNTQVLALAEGLGWPFEIKRLVYRKTELLSNLLLGPTLAGVRTAQSSPLEAPWPDLVITAGRRNEPVARWIQRQADKTVRIVHLGRPWATPERFDLIVTTPQYQLPRAANILHNTLPRISQARLAEAAAHWATDLEALPEPRIALLVGGNSGPYTLDPAKATLLAEQAEAMAREAGGSLLITTSARTPLAAVEMLAQKIRVPCHFHRWRAGAADNPYFAYLALAEAFIVTGDSVSMLTEACATGKPVHIFDLADGPEARRPRKAGKLPWWRYGYNYRFRPLSHRLGMALGPRRMGRDVRRMQEQLIREGRAAWLGGSFAGETSPHPAEDLSRAVKRIRCLFPETGQTRAEKT